MQLDGIRSYDMMCFSEQPPCVRVRDMFSVKKPAGLAEPPGSQRGCQVINLRIAWVSPEKRAPASDKALIVRQTSQDVRESLVAVAGRTRRSKWFGDVPTLQSRAFVCSKHVLSDEACRPISECCLSNHLILSQQQQLARRKETRKILRSSTRALYAD